MNYKLLIIKILHIYQYGIQFQRDRKKMAKKMGGR